MSRLLPLSLLLAACAVDDAALLPAEAVAPSQVLTLTHTPLVVGQDVTITVTGATPNTSVFLFRAPRVTASGFCPRAIAPVCMDLAGNVVNTFQMRSNASGVASVTFRFPTVPAAATDIAMQAGYPNSTGADTSNPVLAVIHQPGSDLDGDRLTAEEELAFGTDPILADSDGGGTDDAYELAAGTNPSSSSDDAGVPVTVTWSNNIAGLLQTRCSGCHTGGSASGGLNLDTYGNLFGGANQAPLPIIDAGSVAGSYLWHKVQGTQASVGGSGARMPRGRTPLPEDELLALRLWIEDGAPRT